jgi:hypothetical protein
MTPRRVVRGAGAPEEFITRMKSLVPNPIEFYSCFISYSTKDKEFAKRLHGVLKNEEKRDFIPTGSEPSVGHKIRDPRWGRVLSAQADTFAGANVKEKASACSPTGPGRAVRNDGGGVVCEWWWWE